MTDMHVPTEITSSHIMFSLRAVSKCVYHAPGFLIECRVSLVGRPSGIPEIRPHRFGGEGVLIGGQTATLNAHIEHAGGA